MFAGKRRSFSKELRIWSLVPHDLGRLETLESEPVNRNVKIGLLGATVIFQLLIY